MQGIFSIHSFIYQLIYWVLTMCQAVLSAGDTTAIKTDKNPCFREQHSTDTHFWASWQHQTALAFLKLNFLSLRATFCLGLPSQALNMLPCSPFPSSSPTCSCPQASRLLLFSSLYTLSGQCHPLPGWLMILKSTFPSGAVDSYTSTQMSQKHFET